MTNLRGFLLLILICAIALALSTIALAEERYALLIGIDNYDSGDISDLTGAVNDVKQIRASLIQCCSFKSDNVFYLTSDRDHAHQARIGAIVTRLGEIKKVVKVDDAFVFFFSGHGIERDDRQYLLTQGANTSSVEALQHTALPLQTVKELLESIPATKKIVIIDSCRERSWQQGRGDGKGTELTQDFARGIAISFRAGHGSVSFAKTLFACQPGHIAWEYPGKRQGFFSYFLTQALRGDPEALDHQGNLTLATLERYLEQKVDSRVKREKGSDYTQIPWFSGEGCGTSIWRLAHFEPGEPSVGQAFQVVPSDEDRFHPPLGPFDPGGSEPEVYIPPLPAVGKNPPKIEFVEKPPASVSRKSAKQGLKFTFRAEADSGIARYDYRLDNEPVKSTPRMELTLKDLASGTHQLQVQVVDMASNASHPAVHKFTVRGNERPAVRFVSPSQSGSKVRAKLLKVKLSAIDTDGRVNKYRCALGNPNSARESASGEFEFQAADGTQRLYGQAEDDEGGLSDWAEVEIVYEYTDEATAPFLVPEPEVQETSDVVCIRFIHWDVGSPLASSRGVDSPRALAGGSFFPEHRGLVTAAFVPPAPESRWGF